MTSEQNIIFTPITKLDDAQVMRVIRNECKDYMTRDTSFITEEQQEKWFSQLDLDNIKMFLMHICYHGAAIDTIGFGYCRRENDEVYVTGGLRPDSRDKGYGKLLFTYLVEQSKSFDCRITLEVLNSNSRAKRLYEKIGFYNIDKNDRITKMEHKND